jgi:hypothetical protein
MQQGVSVRILAVDGPSSACRSKKAICCALNRVFRMETLPPGQDG